MAEVMNNENIKRAFDQFVVDTRGVSPQASAISQTNLDTNNQIGNMLNDITSKTIDIMEQRKNMNVSQAKMDYSLEINKKQEELILNPSLALDDNYRQSVVEITNNYKKTFNNMSLLSDFDKQSIGRELDQTQFGFDANFAITKKNESNRLAINEVIDLSNNYIKNIEETTDQQLFLNLQKTGISIKENLDNLEKTNVINADTKNSILGKINDTETNKKVGFQQLNLNNELENYSKATINSYIEENKKNKNLKISDYLGSAEDILTKKMSDMFDKGDFKELSFTKNLDKESFVKNSKDYYRSKIMPFIETSYGEISDSSFKSGRKLLTENGISSMADLVDNKKVYSAVKDLINKPLSFIDEVGKRFEIPPNEIENMKSDTRRKFGLELSQTITSNRNDVLVKLGLSLNKQANALLSKGKDEEAEKLLYEAKQQVYIDNRVDEDNFKSSMAVIGLGANETDDFVYDISGGMALFNLYTNLDIKAKDDMSLYVTTRSGAEQVEKATYDMTGSEMREASNKIDGFDASSKFGSNISQHGVFKATVETKDKGKSIYESLSQNAFSDSSGNKVDLIKISKGDPAVLMQGFVLISNYVDYGNSIPELITGDAKPIFSEQKGNENLLVVNSVASGIKPKGKNYMQSGINNYNLTKDVASFVNSSSNPIKDAFINVLVDSSKNNKYSKNAREGATKLANDITSGKTYTPEEAVDTINKSMGFFKEVYSKNSSVYLEQWSDLVYEIVSNKTTKVDKSTLKLMVASNGVQLTVKERQLFNSQIKNTDSNLDFSNSRIELRKILNNKDEEEKNILDILDIYYYNKIKNNQNTNPTFEKAVQLYYKAKTDPNYKDSEDLTNAYKKVINGLTGYATTVSLGSVKSGFFGKRKAENKVLMYNIKESSKTFENLYNLRMKSFFAQQNYHSGKELYSSDEVKYILNKENIVTTQYDKDKGTTKLTVQYNYKGKQNTKTFYWSDIMAGTKDYNSLVKMGVVYNDPTLSLNYKINKKNKVKKTKK